MRNHLAATSSGRPADTYVLAMTHRPWRAGIRLTAALTSVFVLGLPALAHAQAVTGGASPATMINNICTFILGPFGQSLAVLGIIAIGLSWMFGRVSLGLIAGVIGGIVIMFGASYLGSMLTGGAAG
jgi:type IV secretory pathway VirB2 component (pilin)